MLYCPQKYISPRPDFNKEFLSFEGELEDNLAKITLAKFLRYNLGLTTEMISGIKLAPYQEVIIRGWFNRNFSLAVLGRGAGKCQAYSERSLVLTREKGLISLLDLLPNLDFNDGEKWIDIPKVELWNGTAWVSSNKLFIQPKTISQRLNTSMGFEICGSNNHKVKVINRDCEVVWKTFEDIKVGDYVCISRNHAILKETASEKDKNESYLIGLLLGDGRFSKKIKHNLSKDFSAYLLNKYNTPRGLSYSKEIPRMMFLDRSLLKRCLQGLFDSDGSVTEREIEFSSTSERMAIQVHLSLALFGVIGRLKMKKKSSPFGKTWRVSISGESRLHFLNNIGFNLSRKNDRLKKSLRNANFNTNKDIIPYLKEDIENVKGIKKKNQKKLTYKSLLQYIPTLEREDPKRFGLYEKILKENFFFDEVVGKIESTENCVDFNIPEGNAYWSNGFVNHNSFLAAVYCFLRCIFEPRTKILIAGPTFRTARNIFTELEKIVKSPESQLLAQAFNAEPSHKNDLLSWKINEGSIVAIPLNGEKIRGFRCNVLILDEFLLLSREIVENVLMPFLIAPQNIGERLKIREMENDLIKSGEMKEEDRMVFSNTSQLIALSSASFTFENLYKTYKDWMGNIYDETVTESTYFVAQLGYQAIPEEMVEKAIIEEAQAGGLENPSFLREYCAQFTDGSDGYFSAKKMQECTIPDGENPHLKLIGDRDKKFIIAIDPNMSNSASADFFAMAVLEIDEETETSTLVHNYANAGGDLKDHISYFYYLMQAFNPVLIICDSADGNFIPSCNETEDFINNKINLKFLDEWSSDLDGEDYSLMIKKVRRQYNLEVGAICIKQFFTSDFIRKANESLQGAIDYKKIWFGSRIRPDASIFDKVRVSKVPLEKTGYNFIGDMIDSQDELIYNVKKQCALIEVKTTAKGNQSFELPTHLKRSKDPKRARKDNYTALMLGNWGVKAYLDIIKTDVESSIATFSPIFIK